jgi:alkylation response protein AidB-like acyl-CoA dehydrogenase
VRTNWDVPKHDGISVLIMKIDQPGIRVDRIVGVAGDKEFCQEFFDDVRIPAENVVGEVDAGWTVVRNLLANERNSMGGASIYISGGRRMPSVRSARTTVLDMARIRGTTDNAQIRQLVAEEHVMAIVQEQLSRRVAAGMATGHYPPPAGALVRLMGARNGVRRSDIQLEIAGSGVGAWPSDDAVGEVGIWFLARQGSELGGGSTEMQRNIISERMLQMPREFAADRGVPFKDVRRSALPTTPTTPTTR